MKLIILIIALNVNDFCSLLDHVYYDLESNNKEFLIPGDNGKIELYILVNEEITENLEIDNYRVIESERYLIYIYPKKFIFNYDINYYLEFSKIDVCNDSASLSFNLIHRNQVEQENLISSYIHKYMRKGLDWKLISKEAL